jgi:hypothetical protein
MNQDFHDYYSKLSTVELLQIQAEKEKYQPEAIEALEAVLQARTVTTADHEYVQEIADAQYQKVERIKEKREAFVKSFVDMTKPGEEKAMQQQLVFFCGGLTILYLLSMYSQLTRLYRYSHGTFFSARADDIFPMLVDMIITPVMIILLYKKKKAGWIMAAFIYTFSLILSIDDFLMRIRWNSIYYKRFHMTRYTPLITLVILGAILYYLNTRKFTDLFSITRKHQRTTIILGAVAALIFMVGLSLM